MTSKTKAILRTSSMLLLVAILASVCALRWRVWFVDPRAPQWQGDTIAFSFRTLTDSATLAAMPTQVGYEFLVLGDVHNGLTKSHYQTLRSTSPQAAFYVQLGDFVERSYSYYYQSLYQSLYQSGLDTLPILACAGNHEYRKGLHRVLPSLWYERFPMPLNGPSDFLGSTYFVDLPNLRIIVIDTNGLRFLHHYTRTLSWLNQTIAAAKKDHRFVLVGMHHPVYSSAVGRANPLLCLHFSKALQQADFVFAGHDHLYARRLPFINTTATDRSKLPQLRTTESRVASACALFHTIYVSADTLRMRAYILRNAIPCPPDSIASNNYLPNDSLFYNALDPRTGTTSASSAITSTPFASSPSSSSSSSSTTTTTSSFSSALFATSYAPDSIYTELYDEVLIIRQHDASFVADTISPVSSFGDSVLVVDIWKDSSEYILLPARYEGREDRKIRRFESRRAQRASR